MTLPEGPIFRLWRIALHLVRLRRTAAYREYASRREIRAP